MNIFSDEEVFRDIPDEVDSSAYQVPLQQQAQVSTGQLSAPQDLDESDLEEYLNIESQEDLDPEEDYADVLADARLRLEQGRLYEMIMNHDLFANLDADARAVKNVQREIKKFAKERMEIMLGMKRESATVERLEIDFPFNELEVSVLKKLAFTATKGATEKSDNFVPQIKKVTEEIPNVPAKRSTLTPIGPITSTKKSAPAKAKADPKPLAKSAGAPLERRVAQPQQRPAESKPLEKSPYEMTADELLARNEEITARQKRAISKEAMPMPTYEQQEYMYQTRVAQHAPAVSQIVALINQRK